MDDLLREARKLLAERSGVMPWTHAHCDENPDGAHGIDDEWWDKDAAELVARIDDALHQTDAQVRRR